MPKKTERQLLAKLAAGQPLTASEIDSLSLKIAKGQSKKRARTITQQVELRYTAQLGLLTAVQRQQVVNAVRDYTMDSTTINNSCRAGAPNANATRLDQVFQVYHQQNWDNDYRVTYRLMTYKPADNMPWGAAAAPHIVVGDRVRDDAFLSASENRQLLVNGVENPGPNDRYVKIAIYGRGGINISGGSLYSNANERAMMKNDHPKTWRFRTAHAGQAEILYDRGTVFRVRKITPNGNDVHVVLAISNGGGGGGVKNMFTGT
ncbi:hypothetical protein KOR42_28010 [Thalassoglobus neptunius]|uniref:ADP-ribosyltransferase exoenzyme n=1 Tax=Thalassoglobus neptunius TaxID=1938619 RepID=A0A5C5WZR7_9PLAN|nr:hypothetical protein [Thalassoglobus neptunius]TWT55415.1 hypothetical protein KOR42_28010 [Thalassoglobus neptunius]